MRSGRSTWTANRAGFLHLLVVYLVWGSTYLAIRIAVRPGAGFEPFIMGAMRALAAGTILLTWGLLRKSRLRLTRRELVVLAGSGVLLWTGGNGLVMVGERHADSGLAALIIAGTPLWVTIIDAIWGRKTPTLRLIGALLIGTLGIVVLSYPSLSSGLQADWQSIVIMVGASISWAVGTVWQTRVHPALDPPVSSGFQCLFGGLGFVVMALLAGESLPAPTTQAWLAWVYLVLFGSVLAFTSYIQALRLLPVKIVTTYGYVNPIIAVILGWLILREPVTIWTVAGAALVLLGVTGVFREQGSSIRH